MSEPIQQTPEQIAAAVNARINELDASKGKWYLRKDGKELPTQVLGYAGTRIHQEQSAGKPVAVNSHVFKVRALDGREWTPPASQFLDEHNEIPAPEQTNPSNQPV